MIENSDFNFKSNSDIVLELPFSEHIEELRQRSFQLVWFILLLTCLAFFEVKELVKILELPVTDVKFFQASPGEYFLSTLKILHRITFWKSFWPRTSFIIFTPRVNKK